MENLSSYLRELRTDTCPLLRTGLDFSPRSFGLGTDEDDDDDPLRFPEITVKITDNLTNRSEEYNWCVFENDSEDNGEEYYDTEEYYNEDEEDDDDDKENESSYPENIEYEIYASFERMASDPRKKMISSKEDQVVPLQPSKKVRRLTFWEESIAELEKINGVEYDEEEEENELEDIIDADEAMIRTYSEDEIRNRSNPQPP